ncbi:MAG: glycogen debranching protein GlgX [Provencibacterium sp.]|nr:glycogen debranching protein GlgX [Provencibacterium sp.]
MNQQAGWIQTPGNMQLIAPCSELWGFKIRPGFFLENGATPIPGGVNFTVHSRGATGVELALFRRGAEEPFAVLPFPESCRMGNVYSMIVFGLEIDEFEYAYRVDGPWDPAHGQLFDRSRYLLDPYARAVSGQSNWGNRPPYGFKYRARVVANDFDWGNSVQPHLPMKELIIYELHVRGFTRHSSSGVRYPGTFAGLAEKVPYLKELGINAVELMPVFEFDEMRDDREKDGHKLLDYWGYNPVCFFAPNTSYASGVEHNREGDELKSLIRLLHENGIEVILDVVFNHTAEGDERGPYISFRGFDNRIYYLLTPDGKYYNFSGCGNTMNCNHPIVQRMILDCLRYWVSQYRVDGFRFDLASILGRDENGVPMNKPPLLQSLAFDPVLGGTKLIAEAWDAGGLYQVGSFPAWGRWSEWNGRYRDDLRRFLKGDEGLVQAVATRIAGSQDLYDPATRGEGASVNFITCHDGFTLHDLYAYNYKHNEQNGWDNTDGENNNNSWNCGAEGYTEDLGILRLRRRLIKNACAVLMMSHGVPMFLAGDEFGNTQFGNNNAYCQDNEISWLDWGLLEKNSELLRFFQYMIRLRRTYPALRSGGKQAACGLPNLSFHGEEPWRMNASPQARTLGVLFTGRDAEDREDDILYLAINAHWENRRLRLPDLPQGRCWRLLVDTFREPSTELDWGEQPQVGGCLELNPRSVAVLIGR